MPDEPARLDEALPRLLDGLAPAVGTEFVDLRAAAGRILAEDVVAPRDLPPHDNSAMDGYAVRFRDLDVETRLPVSARVAAGHPPDAPVPPGTAARIFTGAAMPEDLDTVVMQEECVEEDGYVTFPAAVKAGANVRPRGEDVKAGAATLMAGTRLRPQDIARAATLGRAELRVFERLRACVFSTGDEIRDPGEDDAPGTIFDANRYGIMALLEGLGFEVTDLGILKDDVDVVRDALLDASGGHHVVVTSGGVSMGDEDHVKAAVQSAGVLDLWRLAIKPGRPLAFGRVEGAVFIGLPGNPVAALATFMRVARPIALRLAGQWDAAPALFRVRAGFDFKRKPGRREWVRARLDRSGDEPVAVMYPTQGSGVLNSMIAADGLVELPEDAERVVPGDMVDFLPFSEVLR